MMKELDTDEVYLFDGGDSDAEIWRTAEGTPFGPYTMLETTSGYGETGFVEVHSPDTAARLALALLARAMDPEEDSEYTLGLVMSLLGGVIRVEEQERDFKIGEHVEVFDASYGDTDWRSARVLEYSRHGGYFVRAYGGKLDFYSPAHIRKVGQDD